MTTSPDATSVEQLLSSRWNRWVLYLVLFVFAAIIRLASFMGIVLSDDMWYAEAAQKIAQGSFEPATTHLGLRIGLTVPVAAVYRLFGAGELTTILVPLVASSLTIPMLVAAGRRIFSTQAALLAGLLLATLPAHVICATILVPEPVVEFWILAGVLLYLQAGQNGDRASVAALAGLCFGLAYLAKEVALFVGAAFFLYSVARGRWRLALAMAGGMAVVGALEVIYYLVQTGDLLYRSHVIAKSQQDYFSTRGGFAPLGWRLFKAYPYMMLVPSREFAFHSLAAILLALVSLFALRGERVWMLLAWAAVPMLYLNFGSSSFSRYDPIAVGERYIILVYYPLLLLAGAVLTRWLSKPGAPPRYLAPGILVLFGLAGIAGINISSAAHFNPDEQVFRGILAGGPWFLLALAMIRNRQTEAGRSRSTLWSVFALMLLAGSGGALAYRNYSTYYPEIRALRGILQRAERQSYQIIRIEGSRAALWGLGVELLSRRKFEPLECTERCLVIAPGVLGIPVATEVPGGRAEIPPRL